MNASHLLRYHIIKTYEGYPASMGPDDESEDDLDPEVTLDTVDKIWAYLDEHDEEWLDHVQNVARHDGSAATGLTAPTSRVYECEMLAREIEGRWVAWPCWYGGGKHGEPEWCPWIEHAVFVTMTERVVTERVFALAGSEVIP